MEQRYPETEQSPEAAEGEAAHWAVSEMLSGRLVEVGQPTPNGMFLTEEMVEGADMLYDDVLRCLKPHGAGLEVVAVESAVDIKYIHPEVWGTPDARAWVPGPRLYLWDYKFGHRVVEVFENAQLVDYAIGVCDQAGKMDSGAPVEIVFRIVQPRAHHREGPTREWRTTLLGLRALANLSSNAVHNALGDAPRTGVGPECRDCKARHACSALQRAALSACDEAVKAQPLELPPEALGLELTMLKRAETLLSARIVGLEQHALASIRAGNRLPGWAMEPGVGRQRWAAPAADVIAVAESLGVKIAKPAEPLTPLQALKAGLPAEVVSAMSDKPKGPVSLVADDGSKARSVFSVS